MAILRKPPWWDAFVSWRFWKMCPIPTLQTTGSLLCRDGRHLGFVHATDRSKFNCSWAVPRSARGCWIHGRHRGMSLELLLIPLISAQEYLVRVPWLRAPFETALTPKTLQKFCCTKYPHRTKTAAQNWMVCSFLPLSQEQEGGKKISTTAPFPLTLSGTPCPSISDNSWGCSMVVMQDLALYPTLASSWSQGHSLGLSLDYWLMGSQLSLSLSEKLSAPRNFCCLMSSCFLTNNLENLFLSE